jgi:Uma2 family endonuclease
MTIMTGPTPAVIRRVPTSEARQAPNSSDSGSWLGDSLTPVTLGKRLYRLNVNQYEQMIESKVLTEDDPVELLEGLLVTKTPRELTHLGSNRRVIRHFQAILPQGFSVFKRDPVRLLRSVPEPDAVIVRGDEETFDDSKPTPADIVMIVEVADSSYSFDREKRFIYADAGIPIYWIVNITGRRIEVYSEPTGPDPQPEYKRRHDYGADALVPVVIDSAEIGQIAVSDLLPPESERPSES